MKTAHVQGEHKYTTKANVRIRIQTSDPSLFRYIYKNCNHFI